MNSCFIRDYISDCMSMKKISPLTIITICFGAILFLVVLNIVGFSKIIEAIKLLSFSNILILCAVFAVQLTLWTISLKIILASFGYKLPFKTLAILNSIKYTFSCITPFLNTGGEPVQIYLLYKEYDIPLTKGTTAVFLERMLRFTVSLSIVVLGIFYVFSKFTLPNNVVFVCLVSLLPWFLFVYIFYKKNLAGEGFIHFILALFGIFRFNFVKKIEDPINKIDQDMSEFLTRHKKELASCLALSFISVLMEIVQIYLLLSFLHSSLTMPGIFLIFLIMKIAMFIPVPGALGVLETGITGAFVIQNMASSLGFVFTLVFRFVGLILAIPGMLFFPYFGIKLRKALSSDLSSILEYAKNNLKKQNKK